MNSSLYYIVVFAGLTLGLGALLQLIYQNIILRKALNRPLTFGDYWFVSICIMFAIVCVLALAKIMYQRMLA